VGNFGVWPFMGEFSADCLPDLPPLFKRLFDILVAAFLLLLTLPLMLATAVAVHLALGAPVLLRQTRPGKGGAPFLFFEFRT
jgi:sugar transferase EpsL